jgi:hypothetical protein
MSLAPVDGAIKYHNSLLNEVSTVTASDLTFVKATEL